MHLRYWRRLRFGTVEPVPAALIRAAFKLFESHLYERKKQAWHKAIPAFLVRVGRLELPASCSQSRRATNCATPGY